jgi:hypothetical protein
MDRKFSEKTEIEELIRLSAAARSCLDHEAAVLRKRLDFPMRMRDSLASHPGGWMLGSLASGLLASVLFRRRSRAAAPRSKGVLSGLLGLTLTAAKPLAKVWLANQVKDWMTRPQPSSHTSPTPRPLPGSQSF